MQMEYFMFYIYVRNIIQKILFFSLIYTTLTLCEVGRQSTIINYTFETNVYIFLKQKYVTWLSVHGALI